jgi:hypothetical protein
MRNQRPEAAPEGSASIDRRTFRALLDARPFKPFRVWICSGRFVDVVRTDTTILLRSCFATAVRPNRKGIAQGGVVSYDYQQVVKITPLRRRLKPRKRTA